MSSSQSEVDFFQIGSVVVVHGLQTQKDLNGQYGQIKSDLKMDRYDVYINMLDKTVRIKPKNLQLRKSEEAPDTEEETTTIKKKLQVPPHDLGRMFYFTTTNNIAGGRMESEEIKNLTHKDLTYIHDSIDVSVDPTKVMSGRGLINCGSQTIKKGELLFVTPPTVAVDIKQVLRVYKSGGGGNNNSNRTRLEQIAETILLKQMKRHVKKHIDSSSGGGDEESKNYDNDSSRIATSFLFLTNGDINDERRYKLGSDFDSNDSDDPPQSVCFKTVLMGQHHVANSQQPMVDRHHNEHIIDDDYLLGIIRHNAFGPDFHNYERMEREIDEGRNHSCYRRILAHYPFAAMINHSCTTNAQRVYAEYNGIEVMIATASKPIQPGEEIVWSYIPPIVDYERRQEQLLKSFGFECKCQRCQMEECKVLPLDADLASIHYLNQPGVQRLDMMNVQDWQSMIQKLDSVLKGFDNSTARSLRLGWTYFYLNYFNAALQQEGGNEEEVLAEAMKLHFSFVEVHNACTEHLSILHMCYDLSRRNGSSQMQKRKMIVEALRVAHMCRYSDLAFVSSHEKNDGTDRLRAFMAHTQVILRNQNGWQMVAEMINQQHSKRMSSSGDANSYQVKMKAPII